MTQEAHQGTCYCGAVQVTVTGPPVAAGYCHCESCRKWHAAPINAWSAWPQQNVEIKGDVITSSKTEKTRRKSCSVCGGCVANELPGPGMIAVYPMTLFGSDYRFEPTMHLFYDERVMDVSDGIPKFRNAPEGLGGSGEVVDDGGRTGWC